MEKIVKGEPIPVLDDSNSRFQFVYVKDVANAIIACVERERADESAYNLSAPEELSYQRYMEVLGQVNDLPFTTRPVTVEQVARENIPLTAEEDELYAGDKIARELGLSYTPFREGMERAYEAFKGVYAAH